MKLPFSKLNGIGNNFIMMNDLDGNVSGSVDVDRLTRQVCDVAFGVGADGLILVRPGTDNEFRMSIYNSDGSESEMCGNGIRCMVRFLEEENISRKQTLTIDTLAGPIVVSRKSDGLMEVDMGTPAFHTADVVAEPAGGHVTLDVGGFPFTFVSMGNPHAVTFVDAFDFDWKKVGASVEMETAVFPNRTNVEFARVDGNREMTMKVWERGCGETMACGTGTCAMVVAAVHTGRMTEGDVLVHLPGGDLSIQYFRGQRVRMTGPAVTVCKGVYNYE